MSTAKKNIEEELLREIAELRAKLEGFDAKLEGFDELHRKVSEMAKSMRASEATPRRNLWPVIADYLKSHGGKASPQVIVEGLQALGHDLGKYPLRNVKITVKSPTMINTFSVKRDSTGAETVVLLKYNPTYAPMKWEPGRWPKKPAK